MSGSVDQALANFQRVFEERKAREAAEPAKPPLPAKVVQFPIPFPADKPPVCNIIARTALFAAIKSKDRRQIKKEIIASQESIQIIFSGEQLNQDDHDTFMQLVKLASGRPLEQDVTVPANAILRALGRGNGKSQHEQLKADMYRLMSGTVEIHAKGIYYAGHLVDYIAQDEREPTHKRHWVYRLNSKLATLFGRNQYTLNNWESRQQLSQKYLAKWLQLWIEGNAEQYPTAVETIHKRCGSRTASLPRFRQALKCALEDLKNAGIINEAFVDSKTDLVHIGRSPNDSQAGHIRKKAERKKRDRVYADKQDPRKNDWGTGLNGRR